MRGAVVERGAVLWCRAMAMAHHTDHGQVRACAAMAHTTHTAIHTALGGGGSVVWRARATQATPPCEPGVGGRIEWHWQRGRQSGGFARHRRPVHEVVVLACHAADVVDHAGVPRTEGGGIGGKLRRRRRCAAARGTAAARAATRRAAARATAAVVRERSMDRLEAVRAAAARAAAARAAAARAAAAQAAAARAAAARAVARRAA